ncbi:MAG: 16S rRNA (uracil(1498)-N(3))-methyltransferase [Myxococcales bacterium]|nr:16S rRNA (uracil(1498)-N(3))-methyltransferase [Myxococcales bacterium]MCB9731523.1 16S rRNA (uracil(1498)-N(3))-methyltransferase [Deltaproteobacteria bacterium]
MSRLYRFDLAMAPGETVRVPERQAHHLAHVLRVGVGARLVAVGLGERAFVVEVTSLDPLTVRVVEETTVGADPAVALEVWVPLLKGGKSDDVVRQLVELGASRIVPFQSAHAVVRLDGKKASLRRERWQEIADLATQQCARVRPVEVAAVSSLPEGGDAGVFFWEEPGPLARDVLAEAAPSRILFGPEGGLAAREVEALRGMGWRSAWLGPRILKADTATVAGAALALSALGEGGY